VEPSRSTLAIPGLVVLGGFALTESFAALPGAAAAYAAAWWVLGLAEKARPEEMT